MTCVDNATYAKAVADCSALQTVKGLGSPNYIRRGQIRGVGDTIPPANYLVIPASTASTGNYDPCAIASQTPCPAGGGDLVCPTGTFKSCILGAPGSPAKCNCLNVTPTMTTTKALVPTTATATTTTTAGFSQWGLLAAVAAAGIGYAVYAHSKKKKAS